FGDPFQRQAVILRQVARRAGRHQIPHAVFPALCQRVRVIIVFGRRTAAVDAEETVVSRHQIASVKPVGNQVCGAEGYDSGATLPGTPASILGTDHIPVFRTPLGGMCSPAFCVCCPVSRGCFSATRWKRRTALRAELSARRLTLWVVALLRVVPIGHTP